MRSLYLLSLLLISIVFASSQTITYINYPTSTWSGYAVAPQVANGTITQINATWTVPTITISQNSYTYLFQWIGIGGLGSSYSNLIQTGTASDNLDGTPQYYAWIETLPNLSTFEFPVNPGDSISANIRLIKSGLWQVEITDLSTNQTFNQSIAYTSNESTAEWIVERPSVDGVSSALSHFNTTAFNNTYVSTNNVSTELCNAIFQPISMVDSDGYVNAYPSPINNCDSFNITYVNPYADLTIQAVNETFTEINNAISNTDNSITDINNSIVNISNNISNLSNKLNTTNSNLVRLGINVNEEIQQIQNNQQALQQTVTSDEQTLSSQEQSQQNQLVSLSNSLLQLSNSTDELALSINLLNNKTNNLNTNINVLSANQSSDKQLIYNNTQTSETNSKNINMIMIVLIIIGIVIVILLVLIIRKYIK